MIQEWSYKISANVQIKQMDFKEKVTFFFTSESSVKGTSEEGTNVYGAIVVGIIILSIALPGLRLIFGGIMGDFQDGTTKTPANWS
ncbi:hypothetical protein QK289_15480 [Exiguobacterium antarcticum]|uniref:Uncharacterized protein n=1 Tax=Exiguobacterium antarcticum TaxID=132920 RepID=A0ABT6R649_9BACL|nr:hypothetical protein [Exiguobacterium antarcticum]MDI3236416.1 hypothetical protein [Exiguobacterium antarcticum]